MSNQYHIARKVEPGNSKEMFRAHFDSHLLQWFCQLKFLIFMKMELQEILFIFHNQEKFQK